MAQDLYPVAGMKFYIGGALASKKTDFIASDFDAQVWNEIDGWEQAGAIGDARALITKALINRNRDVKIKGTANAGSMANVFSIVPGDAGQEALIAASVSSSNYAFRIDDNDADGGDPSKRFFIGLVMGAPEGGGGANDGRTMNCTIEINSNIVAVDAT